MKKLFFVANWKANKTEEEARVWIEELSGKVVLSKQEENKEIIICPPFTNLSILRQYILANNLPIKIGAQDISRFKSGAYTGEIAVSILGKDIAYSIVGHSERRQNFNEDDEVLKLKVENAINANMIPIFCIQGKDTYIPKDITMTAYEPIDAIGTGNPATPENADAVALAIKEKNSQVKIVLYGGSVNNDNVKNFTSKKNIDGVLVGGASLEAQNFFSLINQC